MSLNDVKNTIANGQAVLGIEFGSTRIKAVLIGEDNAPIASGNHDWENRLENGIWTYSLEDIWTGLQHAYSEMAKDAETKYGVEITQLKALGFSAMMHGYMPFDEKDELLVPFRTWRNSITEKASNELTALFNFHIPQRWSIAHLYQAILNGEEHVGKITFQTTLAGYIHWQLTGEKVLGIGEASGMFPIDMDTKDYDAKLMEKFDKLVEPKGYPWKLGDILPKVLLAGEDAGCLTEKGARLLDISGKLQAGAQVCPPEGDAGTGMVATNSVARRTGNVSAGTSVFGMVVLEKPLAKLHEELDVVTTPTGDLVAMAHCNNCTSDLNAWVGLFREYTEAMGIEVDMNKIFGVLYNKALEGDAECGGLLAYNYFSGEHITNFEEGRPLFVRTPGSKMNLANFMRVHLFAALSVLKTGLDILLKEEGVKVDQIVGHGGLFKTKGVGQKILAAALDAPVTVMDTAGEGGAWGIAVLASYRVNRAERESLASFLNDKVFAGQSGTTLGPDEKDVDGFNKFLVRYKGGFPIERAAVDSLK